jgi:putative oxidoreductase
MPIGRSMVPTAAAPLLLVAAGPIIGGRPVRAADEWEIAIMNIAYSIGRIFLSVFFIVAGIQKLMNVQAMADMLVKAGVPFPEDLVQYLDYVGKVPKYDFLAYVIGAIEVICGLMILVGLKARWAALVLIVFTACTIFYVHHFWDMPGDAFSQNQQDALKHLSIMGGLLLVVAGGPNVGAMDRR